MTLRQRKLGKTIGKSRTFQEAAIKAGFAPSTARQQQSITKTKGWKKILEEHLPDKELLVVTKEGLKANKIITSHTEPDYEYPDHAIRLKSAEQGYKLKGRYINEDSKDGNINEVKILIMPTELISKYDLPQNTGNSR